MSKSDRDYYIEGWRAYKKGLGKSHCPYRFDTKEGNAWYEGFQDACEEDKLVGCCP